MKKNYSQLFRDIKKCEQKNIQAMNMQIQFVHKSIYQNSVRTIEKKDHLFSETYSKFIPSSSFISSFCDFSEPGQTNCAF